MTPEEKAEMIALRLQGATMPELAKRYGISKQRVHQILTAHQRKRRSRSFDLNLPTRLEHLLQYHGIFTLSQLRKDIDKLEQEFDFGPTRMACLRKRLEDKS